MYLINVLYSSMVTYIDSVLSKRVNPSSLHRAYIIYISVGLAHIFTLSLLLVYSFIYGLAHMIENDR